MESSPGAAGTWTGGCLCGHIRYRGWRLPAFPHTCSCRQCQRWSGAPVVAWADFRVEAFEWTGSGGEPRWFRSSARTRRGSCPECGSSLAAWDDDAPTICVALGSLDDPDAVVPESASFPESAPRWYRDSGGRPFAAPPAADGVDAASSDPEP